MAGINKVIIVGNVGRDPELRYTQQGTSVAKFSVATNESRQNKDGIREEKTEWHRITTWGKLAENCSKYLSKGRQVYVEGRLQTSSWQDKEGNKRYMTEVIAQTVQFLGGPGGAKSPDAQAPHLDEPEGFSEPFRESDSSQTSSGAASSTENSATDDVPF